MLAIFQNFMPGFLFIAFVLLSVYCWYVTLMIDRGELSGFNRRFSIFSEFLFWSEVALGIVIASISIGSWLGGVL